MDFGARAEAAVQGGMGASCKRSSKRTTRPTSCKESWQKEREYEGDCFVERVYRNSNTGDHHHGWLKPSTPSRCQIPEFTSHASLALLYAC